MKKINPALLAVVVMIGLMGLAVFGFMVRGLLHARALQERLSHPAPSLAEPLDPESSEPPPPPEPVDPVEVAAARLRFGSLHEWVAGAEECPQALPSMEAVVTRGPPNAWGVRPVVTPPSPIALRLARDEERALVRMNEPVTEVTMVLLRREWTRPTLDNRFIFTGGRAEGRAFLIVPGEGDGAILCPNEYTATSSARVAADPSELELNRMENELAVTADLVLEERRAAAASLRRAEREPASEAAEVVD